MSILRHLRDLSLVRARVRLLQSSAVVFRADVVQTTSTSVDHNSVAEEQVLFNDDTRIFALKRTSDILRSLFVLKLCSYDVVARKSMVVRNIYDDSRGLIALYVSKLYNSVESHCKGLFIWREGNCTRITLLGRLPSSMVFPRRRLTLFTC